MHKNQMDKFDRKQNIWHFPFEIIVNGINGMSSFFLETVN